MTWKPATPLSPFLQCKCESRVSLLTTWQVDFERIKDRVGHKYARNARAAFVKVWTKLKDGTDGEGSTDNTDKLKAPVKRAGKTAAPRKASEGGPKKPRGKANKKEPEDAPVKGEVSSEEEVEEQTTASDNEGKFHLSFSHQTQGVQPEEIELEDEQLSIREDGFPDGTTDETIKAEAEAIGMGEAEYRLAVRHAVSQSLQCWSNSPLTDNKADAI